MMYIMRTLIVLSAVLACCCAARADTRPGPTVESVQLLEVHDLSDYFFLIGVGGYPGTATIYQGSGATGPPTKTYPATYSGGIITVVTGGGGELSNLMGKVMLFEVRIREMPLHPWIAAPWLRRRYKGIISPNPDPTAPPVLRYLSPAYPKDTPEPTLRSS